MFWTNRVARLLLGGLLPAITSLSVSAGNSVHPDGHDNISIAEEFISAFYSWDATKLTSLMTEDADTVVCATSDCYLLAYPLDDLPERSKGKGNKLINVPPKRLKAGEEFMVGMVVKAASDEILVWAGQRYLRMNNNDLNHYQGERAKRGRKLPRGFQRVSHIELAQKTPE